MSMTEIAGPTVWSPDQLAPDQWSIELDQELADRIEALKAAVLDGADPADTAARAAVLERVFDRVRAHTHDGPGFTVVRGWPVGRADRDEMEFMRFVGGAIGRLVAQPGNGETIDLISERSVEAGAAQPFHTDSASAKPNERPGQRPAIGLLGLLCLREAVSGGGSLVASAHSVHDRLLAASPAALNRLYQDFWWGGRADPVSGENPWTAGPVYRRRGGSVLTRFNDHWIRRGYETRGEELPSAAREAIELVFRTIDDERLAHRVLLRPGDLLLLDNNVVLHAREAYLDHGDPAERRCMVRFWLEVDG
jgi:Taurine catabolism dioxygenase TauD, TfdA family